MRRVRCASTFATATGRLLSRREDVVCREKWTEMIGIFARESKQPVAMSRFMVDVWPATVAPLSAVAPALSVVTVTPTTVDYARIVSLLVYTAHAGNCEHVYILFSALDTSTQAHIITSLVAELCRRRMPATALGLLSRALSASTHASHRDIYRHAVDTVIEAAVKSSASERLLLDFLTAIDPPRFAFGRRTCEMLAMTISNHQHRRLLFELSRLRQPLRWSTYAPIILGLCCTQNDLIFLVNLGRTHVRDSESLRWPKWKPYAFPPSVYPEIIDQLIRIGRPYDALFFFKQLAETEPLTIDLFKLLADCAVRLGRIDIAHTLCRRAVARLRDKPTDRAVDVVSLMTYSVLFYGHKCAGQIDSARHMINKIAESSFPIDPTIVTQYFDMVATTYRPARVIKSYVAMFGSYPLLELGLDNYISQSRSGEHDPDFGEIEQELPQQHPTAISLAILLRCIITHTMYMPHLLTLQQSIKAFVSSGGLDKFGPNDAEGPIGRAKMSSDINAFKKMIRTCIRQQKDHLKAIVAQSDLEF
ncbi:uncharacterized protein V1513DRAFT_448400 [Lipomyces chichibuensis]|uniref:uncharacterized protein n=1 Tax=Lipomyces chichibuensis TaxID=1546026 RepID=UPI003343EFCB